MKKLFLLTVAIIATAILANAQKTTIIDNQKPQNSSIEIVGENNAEIILRLNLNSYMLSNVQTPRGNEVTVGAPDGINDMGKGMPDVPYFATSIRIPSKGKAVAEIVEANYITVDNISIAPSKGAIKRNIDPATVPYEYGKCYSTDAFVPAISATNSEAFCIRDVRGTSIQFFPFQYNPVQKQMKVFTDITVRVKFTQQPDVNEITASYEKIDEFENIYRRLFINYGSKTRYTQVEDGHPGRMLIICKDTYQSAMTDFVTWKREKGIETDMVLMSTVGSTAANVQTYITSYFNEHSDLAYILLVGDAADVPTNSFSSGSGWTAVSGDSDNQYAYLVGDDDYADVFIGRFSGESVANIQNMVRKVILYEKDLTTSDSWLTYAYGSASSQGGSGNSGHNQGNGAESDMVHMGYIQTDLENYGYTVSRVNETTSNGIPATSTAFNNGLGLACYVGHGDTDQWVNTEFSNSDVNALTNENELPFIISVACINGDFNGNTCFAEAWLRASKNGNPTGAIAFLGSTINQDWNPPMTGQDEMIDIITESLDGNIKRTIGGIAFNGYFRMIQDHPISSNSSNGNGPATALAWTIFGDPSTMFRSKTPQEMAVSHQETFTVGQTSVIVTCDTDDALISITKVVDDQTVILGTGYAENGTATIPLNLDEPCTVKLTATAYNKVTYQTNVMVVVPEGPYVVNNGYTINDSEGNNNGAADYNESIKLNQTIMNVGVESANNVSMSISTESSDIDITDNSESFGDIAADESIIKNNAFAISIHDGIADQTSISINYSLSADNCDTRSGSFRITANAPAMAISYVGVDDSENGNNNNMCDAGETVNITFRITNNGHSTSPAGTANLACTNENITITSAQAETSAIEAGEYQDIEFEFTIADNTESGTILSFSINETAGMYSANANASIPVGLQIEDWESNSFDTYAWENSSSSPWTIVSTGAYEGQYCAKSGQIGNSSTSELIITLDVNYNDNVEFYKKVSCENQSWGYYWDFLAFYIDDSMQDQWAGTSDDWTLQSYNVSAGTHTLKWSYEKDSQDTGGSDCAWIDNVKLPAHATITSIYTNNAVADNPMDIYPNPANDNTYININLSENENVSIEIYNTVGQLIKTIDSTNMMAGSNYIAVETAGFNAGMYIVKANIGGKIITKNLSIVR